MDEVNETLISHRPCFFKKNNMPGGKGNIRSEDGKQFTTEYQPQEKWTEENALALGRGLIEWLTPKDDPELDKQRIFYEEYFVIVNDLYPEIAAYLSHKFTSFLKLIEKAKKIQETKLVKYGLMDKLNSPITKFVLANHHDYTDKVEQKIKGKIIKGVKFKDTPNK